MNIFKKVINYIKNIFIKQEEIKQIEAPIKAEEKERKRFINSLKVKTEEKKKQKNIETLISKGDGLGIQEKISW